MGKQTKQGEGEEKAGRGAQDKSLATDRTRAHELDRRLSLHLALLAVTLLIFLVCFSYPL